MTSVIRLSSEEGNRRDLNRNGVIDGSDGGWDMFDGEFQIESTPFDTPPITTHGADEVVAWVSANAGALPDRRDSVDTRIVASILLDEGAIIDSQDDVGGWGTVDEGTPVIDTDGDGMPDAWETSYGTDPSVADNNGDLDGNGYTNLEAYLHARG